MATSERLMGVGVPDEVAKRVGFFIADVTATMTLKGPGNVIARVTAAAASLTLDSSFDKGDVVVVLAMTSASVYPSSTNVIWPTSAGVAKNLNPNENRAFYRISATEWAVLSSV